MIFVTGSLGWLGRSLLGELLQGTHDGAMGSAHRVRALILPGEDPREFARFGSKVEFLAGDVRRAEDCARFLSGAEDGLLFHTAGVIHPRRVKEFYEINVVGTANLLKAAAESGLRRAVIVSSNSPVGCNVESQDVFDETSAYHPYMNYGRSKMEMEMRAAEISRSTGVELVIIRPPWFYGPGQPARQTLFFQLIRRGKMPLLGGGKNRRSMVYMDNLCQGLVLAATVPGAVGQTYWIADRRPYEMAEIIETIKRLLQELGMEVAPRQMNLPSLIGNVAQAIDWGLQGCGFYNQKIHVLSEMNKTIACRIDRAAADLGYEPRIGLEEGMRRSIRSCLERGLPL